ncbi:MAG: hypothetical protein WC725_04715 [Patescibacteria group bacterium]|jgi:hypothetical protein
MLKKIILTILPFIFLVFILTLTIPGNEYVGKWTRDVNDKSLFTNNVHTINITKNDNQFKILFEWPKFNTNEKFGRVEDGISTTERIGHLNNLNVIECEGTLNIIYVKNGDYIKYGGVKFMRSK